MKGEWTTCKLSDCCEINPENLKPSWSYSHLRYIDISSVGEGIQTEPFKLIPRADAPSRAQRLVANGDVLLSTVRPNRRSMLWLDTVEKDYVASTGFAVLRAKPEKIIPRFLYYTVFNQVFTHYLVTMEKGAAYPAVNVSEIGDAQIALPSMAEQKRIVSILGALDDKIELNRRMNAKLEDMARTLFKSWFVDFDPVRAKLEGRQPAGMDAATAALFPDAFEQSALGLMPRGWQATTIGSSIGFLSGFSFKSQDWQGDGIPVVKIGSVKPGLIDLDQVSFVSAKTAKQAARFRLRSGDLLIGMTGYVGEVGLVPPSTTPPLLNQRVGKFILEKPGTESLAFWYCITTQPAYKVYVESQSHGTAQANVSGEAIMSFPHLMPPNEIVRAFNSRCRSIFDLLLSNHGESRALRELRDLKLAKLFGKANSVNKGLR